MVKCLNPKCGFEDASTDEPHYCRERVGDHTCGWYMEFVPPKSEGKKGKEPKEINND